MLSRKLSRLSEGSPHRLPSARLAVRLGGRVAPGVAPRGGGGDARSAGPAGMDAMAGDAGLGTPREGARGGSGVSATAPAAS